VTPAEIQQRVDRVFDRFERMSDGELLTLRAIWDDADPHERERAWASVKSAIASTDRQKPLDDARNRVAKWINNNPWPGILASPNAPSNPSGMDTASVKRAAMPPMLDAIAATIVADSIDARDATILLEPMLQVGS
jgi:hypothetical protein